MCDGADLTVRPVGMTAGGPPFLSRDTYFGELESLISLNRYTYGHANPIRYFGHAATAGAGAVRCSLVVFAASRVDWGDPVSFDRYSLRRAMPTPHINAEPGDFADVCLLPGDPLRAKHIADTFLFDHRQVTDVRNMLGFTGTYRGRTVSVMGSGMGVPSASIYYKELITEYGVDKLIRVGSCGGISEAVGMRDVILASGGCTDSQVNRTRFGGWDFAAVADFGLLSAAAAAAEAASVPVHIGNVFTADLFYNPMGAEMVAACDRMGVLAVEMETAGLYGAAAEFGARALTILTVSDHLKTGAETTADERETTFDDMVRIALDSIV